MEKLKAQSQKQPIPKEKETLFMRILIGAHANFDRSIEAAKELGHTLLQTKDFDLISKHQVKRVKTAIKEHSWIWLGDEILLNETEIKELKFKLEKIFGENVNLYQNSGKLALDINNDRWGIDANYNNMEGLN